MTFHVLILLCCARTFWRGARPRGAEIVNRPGIQLGLTLLALAVLAARFRLKPDDPGDLFPVWVGAGEVLRGHDPYREEISERIQLRVYGRKLTDYELGHGRDQHRFAYPAYTAFVVAPLTLLRYNTAQALACGIFAAFIALSVPSWMRVVGWRPPPALLAWVTVIVLLSPVTTRGLRLVQVGILAGFLLSVAVLAVARNHLLLGGALLAAASIKPQLALLPTAWLILWSLSAIEKRWHLLLGLVCTLLALVAASAALVPRWVPHFLDGLAAYRNYTGTPSAFDAVFGRPWSAVPTLIAFIALARVAWKARSTEASTRTYAWALALTLTVTVWAVPANFDPYNQLLCLPLVFLLGRILQERTLTKS
jgi:Glycosyltransferase family 87